MSKRADLLTRMVSEINAKLDIAKNLKNKTMENLQQNEKAPQTTKDGNGRNYLFNTPEEYNLMTGRRFRHRKDEMAAGLSRLEAFNQRKDELHAPYLLEDGSTYSLPTQPTE